MNLTNYHSHCSFCDGRAPLEDFIKEAIAQGFTSYGVSSHAPLPFPTAWTMDWEQMTNYLEEATELKHKYASRIELYTGLEIDYLNEESHPALERFQALPLDYRIGSVHMLCNDKGDVVDIDVSAEVFRTIVDSQFGGGLDKMVRMYYHRLKRMLELGGFDIVGHADKMHYNASRYRPGILDEEWYDVLVRSYFEEIARRGYMLEVNTKAFHHLGTFYPNERYFPFFKELGMQVQVNSDAHYPEKINSGRPEALAALKRAGYTTVMELHGGQWDAVQMGL